MTFLTDAYPAHQRQRWVRSDARRWIRPDARVFQTRHSRMRRRIISGRRGRSLRTLFLYVF